MRSAVFLLCATVAVSCAWAGSVPCVATDPDNGDVYDLSQLTKTSGEDWIAIDSLEKNNYIYRINVCNDVLFKPNKSMTPLLPGTGAYQQKIDTIRSHNLGLTASPYVEDGVLFIDLEGGDLCDSNQKNRSIVITFACDIHGGLGKPIFSSEGDDCDYHFVWKSSAACPQSQSSSASGFEIFLIVILVLFALYVILGVMYNRFIAGKQGLQQIPNYEFWAGLASALKCWSDNKVIHYSKLPGAVGVADDELNPDEFDDDAIENNDEQHV